MNFKDLRRLNTEYLATIKSVMTLLKDPEQTESVYDVEDAFRRSHPQTLAASVKHMMADPQVAQLAKERYLPPPPDIAKLLLYPPHSLGFGFANYISSSGFDPGFYRKLDIVDDATYLLFRLRQTHDIWHVVTGFSVDVPGELGLKSFEVAQTRRTLSGVLIAGAFLQTLLSNPDGLDRLLDRIAAGYRMGAKAKPLLAQKWEDHWERSVEEIRKELNIEPMPIYVP